MLLHGQLCIACSRIEKPSVLFEYVQNNKTKKCRVPIIKNCNERNGDVTANQTKLQTHHTFPVFQQCTTDRIHLISKISYWNISKCKLLQIEYPWPRSLIDTMVTETYFFSHFYFVYTFPLCVHKFINKRADIWAGQHQSGRLVDNIFLTSLSVTKIRKYYYYGRQFVSYIVYNLLNSWINLVNYGK